MISQITGHAGSMINADQMPDQMPDQISGIDPKSINMLNLIRQ